MLWMERVSFIFYMFINVLLFGFLLFLKHTGSGGPMHNSDFTGMFFVGLFLTAPIWLFFRSIDWLFGGPLRRQIKREQGELKTIYY